MDEDATQLSQGLARHLNISHSALLFRCLKAIRKIQKVLFPIYMVTECTKKRDALDIPNSNMYIIYTQRKYYANTVTVFFFMCNRRTYLNEVNSIHTFFQCGWQCHFYCRWQQVSEDKKIIYLCWPNCLSIKYLIIFKQDVSLLTYLLLSWLLILPILHWNDKYKILFKTVFVTM